MAESIPKPIHERGRNTNQSDVTSLCPGSGNLRDPVVATPNTSQSIDENSNEQSGLNEPIPNSEAQSKFGLNEPNSEAQPKQKQTIQWPSSIDRDGREQMYFANKVQNHPSRSDISYMTSQSAPSRLRASPKHDRRNILRRVNKKGNPAKVDQLHNDIRRSRSMYPHQGKSRADSLMSPLTQNSFFGTTDSTSSNGCDPGRLREYSNPNMHTRPRHETTPTRRNRSSRRPRADTRNTDNTGFTRSLSHESLLLICFAKEVEQLALSGKAAAGLSTPSIQKLLDAVYLNRDRGKSLLRGGEFNRHGQNLFSTLLQQAPVQYMLRHLSTPSLCIEIGKQEEPRFNNKRQRLKFIRSHFAKRCSIGGHDIHFENINLVKRSSFLECDRMMSFGTIELVKATTLDPDDVVIFISRRWQDLNQHKADTDNHDQYKLIRSFLTKNEEGKAVTHIWIDYSCLLREVEKNPDKKDNNPDEFDVIHTAILLSDIFLVVPKVERSQNSKFTDLSDLTRGAWCTVEGIVAILSCSTMFLTFQYDIDPCFVKLKLHLDEHGGSEVENQERLPRQFPRKTQWSYSFAVENAIQNYACNDKSISEDVIKNWKSVLHDPTKTLLDLLIVMKNLRINLRRLISMTLNTTSGFGKSIVEALPTFNRDSDHFLAANVLGNVLGSTLQGFQQIQPISKQRLKFLARNMVSKDDNEVIIDVKGCDLFASDFVRILNHTRILMHRCQKRLIELEDKSETALDVSEQRGSKWIIRLDENYLGHTGVRAVRNFFQGIGNITATAIENKVIEWHGINLVEISLNCNGIGDTGAKELAGISTLTILSLTNNSIGDEGARSLASIPKLSTLDLYNNQVGDEGAKQLAVNTSLTALSLRCNKIGPEGIRALAESSVLTTLNLANNNVGDEGAQFFAQSRAITALGLRQSRVGDDGAKALAENNMLTILNLQSNFVGDEGAKKLATSCALQKLDLYNNIVGDEGAIALAGSNSITSLNLGLNWLGLRGKKQQSEDSHAESAVEAMLKNKSLTKLYLVYDRFTEEERVRLRRCAEDEDALTVYSCDSPCLHIRTSGSNAPGACQHYHSQINLFKISKVKGDDGCNFIIS